MTYRLVCRTLLAAVATLFAIAAPASGRADELLVVVRAVRSAAGMGRHGRQRPGVRRDRADPHGRHPRQPDRQGASTSRRAARTPAPARSRRTSSTARRRPSGSCSSRRAGWSSSSPRRSRASTTRSRPPTTPSAATRRTGRCRAPTPARAGPCSTPRRPELPRRAPPDQGVPVHQHDRVPLLPARLHRQPRRRPAPARRVPALQRRHHAPAAFRRAEPHRQRPARRLHRQVRRRLHRPEGAALRRHAQGRRPRVHLQQGLRRRRRGHAEERAVVPHLSRLRRGRPALPEHVRVRRPRVHRRHLPQRPRRQGPARRDGEPAGSGRLQDALHEPVELQEVADRRRRGRQDDRPHPRRLRQPRRADRLRRLGRRREDRRQPGGQAALAAVGLGRHHARHELDQLVLARQQHPRRRRPARLQLLGPRDQPGQLELVLRLPPRQQRAEPARARGLPHQPRAEPVDGRPADVPRDPVVRGARRLVAGLPARERDRLAAPLRRHVRERHDDGHRADRPRGADPVPLPQQPREARLRRARRSAWTPPRESSRATPTPAAGCRTAPRGCSCTPRSTSR